jgi:hypothetical protein
MSNKDEKSKIPVFANMRKNSNCELKIILRENSSNKNVCKVEQEVKLNYKNGWNQVEKDVLCK